VGLEWLVVSAVSVDDEDGLDTVLPQAIAEVETMAKKVSGRRVRVPLRSIQYGEMPTGTGVATITCG